MRRLLAALVFTGSLSAPAMAQLSPGYPMASIYRSQKDGMLYQAAPIYTSKYYPGYGYVQVNGFAVRPAGASMLVPPLVVYSPDSLP